MTRVVRTRPEAVNFIRIINQLIDDTIVYSKHSSWRKRGYLITHRELGITRLSNKLNKDILDYCDKRKIQAERQPSVYYINIDLDKVALSPDQAKRLLTPLRKDL